MSATIGSLRPDQKNLTLTGKVIDATTVMSRSRGPKGPGVQVAECLIADESGAVIFIARNEQVDIAQKGATITLTGAKVDMNRGSTMRLAVDAPGTVAAADEALSSVNTSNNMSLLEFELVIGA